ncbi:MAG: rRNA pseudouridine synthase [Thermoflexales bacterium]|nr:rRNA pseudouridine synthase [Thermoflexales bacterium]MCS7325386.1 rRNA pseudouridine synthase [Thermoflexales bacterium]MDW8053008.1 pseudouridine synthase [Anaerolineae bacterium]MDW8291661.1 pseudouridine synthase [Anaerolineae bacterium]
MPRYIAFYKPYGVLSAFTHEVRPDEPPKRTLSEFGLPKGVYAAGRLDYDSEGLLILSDDGQFIHRLTHPRHKLPKTYYVLVEGTPTEAALEQLRRGVVIKGYRTQPCRVRVIPPPALPPREKPVTPHGPTAWLEIVLTEGKKRQVRRMTAAVGLPTLRLVRVRVGPVTLDGLRPGQWRDLTAEEVATIFAHTTSPPTRRSRRAALTSVRAARARPKLHNR